LDIKSVLVIVDEQTLEYGIGITCIQSFDKKKPVQAIGTSNMMASVNNTMLRNYYHMYIPWHLHGTPFCRYTPVNIANLQAEIHCW